MKTSIKLLIGITVAILLTMVGAGWSFRQQYDTLDHNNPYAQFTAQTLPRFRILKLLGSPNVIFLVKQSSASVIRVDPELRLQVSHRAIGDTLIVQYASTAADSMNLNEAGLEPSFREQPVAIITTPALQSILVAEGRANLEGWQLPGLALTQTGANGVTTLKSCTIRSLEASVTGSALLRVTETNTIGQGKITLKKKGRLLVDAPVFTSLTLQADSATSVTLPGALLAKIR